MPLTSPLKLILDTDIGTDVDDAWALALCLASPEIELVGISLVHADLDTRARIALKMLKLAGRLDVPVYKGLSKPLTPDAPIYWAGHEGTQTDFSDVADINPRDGAVEFILDTIERYPGEITLCSVGPMSNVGEAIRRAPETMRRVAKLVIMASTYEGEGIESASREHNSCVDPVATRLVMESDIPATVVGLNVTMRVKVRSDQMAALCDTPFGEYLAAMTDQYFGVTGRPVAYMHDPLAVATVLDSSFVTTRKMRAQVLDDGRIAYYSDPGGVLDVCTDVNAESFEAFLISRVRTIARRENDTKCK